MSSRSSDFRYRSLTVTALLAFLAACGGGVKAQRTAILRFENLGPDAADDWLGRAFSEIISESLSADPALHLIPTLRVQAANQALGARPVSAPGVSAGIPPALAAGATRVAYGEYAVHGATMEATMVVEDSASRKIVQVVSASGPSNDVFSLATTLASRLSTHLAKYPTQNSTALRGWIDAQESPNPQAIERALEQAVAADADFAPPYRALAEIRARRQDVPGAIALLQSALARGPSLPAVERARIEGELATLRNDPAARERALADLANLTPSDPSVWRTQAAAAIARHDYRKATEALRKLAELEPSDPNVWKQLGYNSSWAGDLAAAMEALRRYQALRPADADPIDCQGDVNLIHGRLKEAETLYLEADKKDPNFFASAGLFKAAFARLMTGDAAAADAIFARFVDARTTAKDPLVEYRRAEWDWAAGRRKPAIARLEAHAAANESGALRELASRAYTQLAVWYLALGDRPTASRMADRAISTAARTSAANALLVRFMAQPQASPAEWEARAARFFQNAPPSQVRRFTLAGALLLEKQFEPAVPIVKELEASESVANDPTLPILRAWTLVETGHPQEAAPFLRWNPVPQPAGFGSFGTLSFPRIFYLRGVVLAGEGKLDDAKAQYRLFLQLSGPDPLAWGEEKKAKAAL